ncbi:hypothetical protein OsI_31428 [Oryza sativa Indica Group]|uniref:Protein kinase domain-containing protein n=1 Tax=Oryza sativa subsp. indica TaxID=39946 RepID=B8BFB0_ORYSI|nr:hypothetical protein OsI_31428 [Oryza sativa Indica Group]
METLLKASAYILGAAGSSIVYMAVLDDGAVLAVRRIGSDDASPAAWREGWPSSTTRSLCGNIRPSNILLDVDMEPLLADLGIHRLIRGGGTLKPAAPGRFGSKRSAKCLPDLSPPGARPLAGPSGSGDAAAQYQERSEPELMLSSNNHTLVYTCDNVQCRFPLEPDPDPDPCPNPMPNPDPPLDPAEDPAEDSVLDPPDPAEEPALDPADELAPPTETEPDLDPEADPTPAAEPDPEPDPETDTPPGPNPTPTPTPTPIPTPPLPPPPPPPNPILRSSLLATGRPSTSTPEDMHMKATINSSNRAAARLQALLLAILTSHNHYLMSKITVLFQLDSVCLCKLEGKCSVCRCSDASVAYVGGEAAKNNASGS